MRHTPHIDNGVIYCGWDGHEGGDQLWPCDQVCQTCAGTGYLTIGPEDPIFGPDREPCRDCAGDELTW